MSKCAFMYCEGQGHVCLYKGKWDEGQGLRYEFTRSGAEDGEQGELCYEFRS